jgi:hypothetical protein
LRRCTTEITENTEFLKRLTAEIAESAEFFKESTTKVTKAHKDFYYLIPHFYLVYPGNPANLRPAFFQWYILRSCKSLSCFCEKFVAFGYW